MAPAISQDHQGAPLFLRFTGAAVGWVTKGSGVGSGFTVLGGPGLVDSAGGVGVAAEGGAAGAGPVGAGAAAGAGAGPVGARAASAATFPVARSTALSMASADRAPFSASKNQIFARSPF